MERDRLFHILRYVAVPIVVAAITGYCEMRVHMAKEQTKATYEALAPSVRLLMDEVATLRWRVEELSKTTRVIVMRPEHPAAAPVEHHPVSASPPAGPNLAPPSTAPPARPSNATGFDVLGQMNKVEVMVDHPVLPPQKRPAATFDDMLKGL